MKVVLVAHGYPPELVGGTEKSLQALARGLVRQGVEVVVVAGSMQHEQGFRISEEEESSAAGIVRVRRIHRADLFFDHWQKSASARVSEAFRGILREERPDLVHVHHWIRLSRDLVHAAALEGIPAVVTLHDLWTTCLIAFRVRPDTREFCEAPLAPDPCLSCAAHVPPRTPWVSRENQFMALAERRADLVRELELARAVLVPTRSHGEAVGRWLGVDLGKDALQVVPHGRDLRLAARDPLPPPAELGVLRLGSWGHLHPLKGADLILGAARSLAPEIPIELHLAGGEVEPGFAAQLRERAAGFPLSLHGPFEEAQLATHPVTEVHAMVSGSRAHESWGLVVEEAVALGLPLILPRSGAFPERLASGALFYQPGDESSLAQSMQRLWAEPQLVAELRRSLPQLEAVCPTIERHAAQVRQVYEQVQALGPPEVAQPDWWAASLRQAAEEEWDASLGRRSAEELGFPPANP